MIPVHVYYHDGETSLSQTLNLDLTKVYSFVDILDLLSLSSLTLNTVNTKITVRTVDKKHC